MDIKDLVHFLKYESDVDKLIEQAADFCLANNNVPNISQSNLLIAALAVSDQKAGKEPTSQNPFYQDIYRISESI